MNTKPLNELLAELPEKDQRAAIENLESYLTVVIRIYSRIRQSPAALADLQRDLTQPRDRTEPEPLTEPF